MASGCDKSATTGTTSPNVSQLQHFKTQQATTMTPHGRILVETAVEGSDGKIHYQTEDGKKWRVTMAKQPDGNYRYSEPEEVR
jgi:hypothetical protein